MNSNEQITSKIAELEAGFQKSNKENNDMELEIRKLEQHIEDVEKTMDVREGSKIDGIQHSQTTFKHSLELLQKS